MLATAATPAFAGPWTQEEGDVYMRVEARYATANTYFNEVDNVTLLAGDGMTQYSGCWIYGEGGITPSLTAIAGIAIEWYKFSGLIFEEAGTVTYGDVGVRWMFSQLGGWEMPMALEVNFRYSDYFSVEPDLIIGYAWRVEQVAAVYTALTIGLNIAFDGDFAHQLRVRFEGGAHVQDFNFRLVFESALALSDQPLGFTHRHEYDASWLAAKVEVALAVGENVNMLASVRFPFHGSSATRLVELRIGVEFRFAVTNEEPGVSQTAPARSLIDRTPLHMQQSAPTQLRPQTRGQPRSHTQTTPEDGPKPPVANGDGDGDESNPSDFEDGTNGNGNGNGNGE